MIDSAPETADEAEPAAAGTTTTLSQRLALLEDQVAELRLELDLLKGAALTQHLGTTSQS